MFSEGVVVANGETVSRDLGRISLDRWESRLVITEQKSVRKDAVVPKRQLEHELYHKLSQTGYSVHRLLQVEVGDHVIVLSGGLPSFYMRQVAIECVKTLAGNRQIVDTIAVNKVQTTP